MLKQSSFTITYKSPLKFEDKLIVELCMGYRINCYKALVKPVLDYAATVWSPYTQKDIDMVEQVQRRAARFIFNNYSRLASVSEMLTCRP